MKLDNIFVEHCDKSGVGIIAFNYDKKKETYTALVRGEPKKEDFTTIEKTKSPYGNAFYVTLKYSL
jgi:hypothetical protein